MALGQVHAHRDQGEGVGRQDRPPGKMLLVPVKSAKVTMKKNSSNTTATIISPKRTRGSTWPVHQVGDRDTEPDEGADMQERIGHDGPGLHRGNDRVGIVEQDDLPEHAGRRDIRPCMTSMIRNQPATARAPTRPVMIPSRSRS